MTDRLRLHIDAFWISPYSFSAFVALKEKGVPFEINEISLLKKENKEMPFRRASITGRVPALQHGDFWLAESSAIIEYLEDILPTPRYRPVLPNDPKDRAKARMIMAWIRSSRDLMPLIKERSAETLFYEKAKAPLTEEGETSAEKLIEVANLLVEPGRDHLFSAWCIADCDLAFALYRLTANDYPVPDRLKRYADVQWKRPSVVEFAQHARPEFVAY